VSPAEELEKYYYRIYEFLCDEGRIRPGTISRELKMRPSSVTKLMNEAFDHGYIVGPHLRKKSYKNFLEYMYFVKTSNAVDLYNKFRGDNRVVYHAKMIGFSDLWVIAKEKMEIDGEIVAEGPRSDYWLSHALNCSWEDSLRRIKEMVSDFDLCSYVRKGFIQIHRDEEIEWNERDEILFQELKYDVRNPLGPVMREHMIPRSRIIKWLQRLPECCTIATSYFPEGISAYDPYLFMFETEYEDFIIDLFSQFPVSVFFFKVSNKLLMYVHLKRQLLRTVGNQAVEFNRLHIPLLIRELRKKGVITNDSYGIVEYFWGKDL
jgi:hypothetical protein